MTRDRGKSKAGDESHHSSATHCMPVVQSLSHLRLSANQWTIVRQAPLSMGLSRQQYWSGLPWLSTGDLPDPGIEPASLTSSALASGFLTPSTTWEAQL